MRHGMPTAAALIAVMALCVAPVQAGAEGHGRDHQASTLFLLEGDVIAVDEARGEAGLQVVRIELAVEGGTRRILLAPSPVLAEVDFPVERGDRIRVRAFEAEPGEDAAAHKVFNITRERMVRLRTLQRDPLWDGSGTWQGGAGRRYGRGESHHGRGEGHHGKGRRGDR